MARFLMTTTGSEGCVTPFVRLGTALQDRGHEVSLLTHAPFRRRFERSGVRIEPFDTEAEYEAFIEDGALLNDPRTAAECFRRHFIPRVAREQELLSELAQPGTVIVTSETPGISARLAAERLGLPCASVLLYPAHASTMPAYEEFLGRCFGEEIRRLRDAAGLRPSAVRAWWRAPKLHLALWAEWFAGVSVGAVERLEYGGFLWQDDAPAAEVEASQERLGKPAVLMTGGTGKFGQRSFFELCVEACGRLGVEPLLVGRGLKPEAGSLDGASWVGSVPSLARLMRRSRVVVHHGGLGTVGQALAAGTPQLIGASGGDRPNNGSLVEALGAGVYLPRFRWSVDAIAEALARTLDDGVMAERCRSLAGRFPDGGSVDRACDALESVAAGVAPMVR